MGHPKPVLPPRFTRLEHPRCQGRAREEKRKRSDHLQAARRQGSRERPQLRTTRLLRKERAHGAFWPEKTDKNLPTATSTAEGKSVLRVQRI